MPTTPRIVQTYRAKRTIEIQVDTEVDDMEEDLKEVSSESIEVPDFEDPRWHTDWTLQSEEIEPIF